MATQTMTVADLPKQQQAQPIVIHLQSPGAPAESHWAETAIKAALVCAVFFCAYEYGLTRLRDDFYTAAYWGIGAVVSYKTGGATLDLAAPRMAQTIVDAAAKIASASAGSFRDAATYVGLRVITTGSRLYSLFPNPVRLMTRG